MANKISPNGVGLEPMRKTDRMLLVERDHGVRDIRIVMRDKLIEHGGNKSAVAEALGLDYHTLLGWLKRGGISVEPTIKIGAPDLTPLNALEGE